jgi:hypothetical protein
VTAADRQLVDWYFAQPGRSTAWNLAIGYLLSGGPKPARSKVGREALAALEEMRTERARSLAR